MHEDLKRYFCRLSYSFRLVDIDFTRQHDSVGAKLFEKQRPFQIVYPHLRRTVDLHVGKMLLGIVKHGQILHDDPVHTYLIELPQLLLHIADLVFEHDGIHRHIYFHISQMRIVDSFLQRVCREVVRICSRAEFLQSQIDRIAAVCYRCFQCLHIACRRQ